MMALTRLWLGVSSTMTLYAPATLICCAVSCPAIVRASLAPGLRYRYIPHASPLLGSGDSGAYSREEGKPASHKDGHPSVVDTCILVFHGRSTHRQVRLILEPETLAAEKSHRETIRLSVLFPRHELVVTLVTAKLLWASFC
ncbi:hypothetical protein F4778DRAFT_400939 [Xylariomycetidae sp. FL2044]|nr:hypothetical protein F4778DRAFT_400939 [Xylariomycetidae sp. FL2044]